MSKNLRKIILIVLAVGAILGLTYIIRPGQSRIEYKAGLFEINKEIAGKPVVFKDYVRVPVSKNGKTALELTQEITAVETKKYDFGVFVENINGTKPDEKHFWKLYLNGQEAQVGADTLKPQQGDVVEWRIEEIK